MGSEAVVIEAERICFRFHERGETRFALKMGALSIGAGERVACVGPSGCGKTTLVRLLTGILRPAEGRVRFEGEDLWSMDERARRALRLLRIGMVFQHFALLDYLSVDENILLAYRLAEGEGLTPERRARAGALRERLGLGPRGRSRPTRLSQGERQRVAIARALVTRPRFIVCDEPTGNLDAARADEAIDLIITEAARIEAALLVVTHDARLLPRFDRVLDLTSAGVREGAAP